MPSQADCLSVSKVDDPESQGTDSVRGTWSSEGHAGRHFRTEAQRRGALNPPLVQPRLDRIAEQAQQYPDPPGAQLSRAPDQCCHTGQVDQKRETDQGNDNFGVQYR